MKLASYLQERPGRVGKYGGYNRPAGRGYGAALPIISPTMASLNIAGVERFYHSPCPIDVDQ